MAIHITSLNHRLRGRGVSRTDELHVTEKRWFAVRTSSRHEKKAIQELDRAGIECYLPLRTKVVHYASKTVNRELPLLTGYVFVRIVLAEELTVRKAHYVSSFVTIGRERRRVTDAEIETLKIISTDRDLDWETAETTLDLREGTAVEIIKGPMAGIRGVYLHRKSKKTFVVSLAGGGAFLSSCEIDPLMLAPIDGAALPLDTSEPHLSKIRN